MSSETMIRSQRSTAGVRLGNLVILLLIAQAATGLVLMLYYRPAPASAYLDLVDLREVSRFGFVRSLHLWGSHAAVILAWLHLLRRALRGTQGSARRRAWFFTVALMLLTVLLAATGYLLRWDQNGTWGLAMLSPFGPFTPDDADRLMRFYVLHCIVLPLLATGLILTHRRLRWKASKH
ncbi:MAG: cytochrome b N-terminal domain-containing protein [Acidobacteriota bacterium]